MVVTSQNTPRFFYQKRIFPDTTLLLNDWKQLSRVSDQVTWNSDMQFSRKQPKTWFLSKNGQILDQKRSKNDQKMFYHSQNLLYLVLNHKLGLKNKNCQTNISRLEEIGQKWSKTSICHHKQCIFEPKMDKTAQTRIFSDTTLAFDD